MSARVDQVGRCGVCGGDAEHVSGVANPHWRHFMMPADDHEVVPDPATVEVAR